MKAIIFVLCAIVLCAFAGEFTPYKLPCGFKIDYNQTIHEPTGDRVLKGWLAMYNKYYASYFKGPVNGIEMELYEICRFDIHDPSDENTVAVFFGMGTTVSKLCNLEEYNKKDSPYHEMSDDYEWFTEKYTYTSSDANAEWKGIKCTSYTNGYSTIYADKDNKIIAINNEKELTLDGFVYHEQVPAVIFTMPDTFPGCVEAVYKDIKKEGDCKFGDGSSRSASNIFAVILALAIAFAMF